MVLTQERTIGTQQNRRVVHHTFYFVLDHHPKRQMRFVPCHARAQRFNRVSRGLLGEFGEFDAAFIAGRGEFRENNQIHFLHVANVINDVAHAI